MSTHTPFLVAIVDDDPSVLWSVGSLLMSAGFHVEKYDGAEAFLRAEHLRQPACLVLDLEMQGMDGFDLLDHVSNVVPIPTIVLTAHTGDDVRRRAFAAGAVAFLSKPALPDALVEAIEQAIARDPSAR